MIMRGEIEEIYKTSDGSLPKFFLEYVKHAIDLVLKVDLNSVKDFAEVLLAARERGSNIFIIGNGGSAANASHFAEDLALLAGGTEEKPFRVISLSDNVSCITALGNDRGFENIFVGQLENFYRPGDVLVVFSGSDNSPNLLKAIDFINEKEGITFGILGFDGGEAKEKCHHSLVINSAKGEFGPVESLQILFFHIVIDYLFFKLKSYEA